MVLMTIEADRSTIGPHSLVKALQSAGITAFCLGLENQRGRKPTVGSNPTLSAVSMLRLQKPHF